MGKAAFNPSRVNEVNEAGFTRDASCSCARQQMLVRKVTTQRSLVCTDVPRCMEQDAFSVYAAYKLVRGGRERLES